MPLDVIELKPNEDLLLKVDKDKLIHDIMESYPEASFCLKCIDWNYNKVEFKFADDEAEKVYLVTLPMLREGFDKLIQLLVDGKYKNGLSVWTDAGNWDSVDADALVQCAIFGDVIYG